MKHIDVSKYIERLHNNLGSNQVPLRIIGVSPFTKALKSRCRAWGVPCDGLYRFPQFIPAGQPYVYDREKATQPRKCVDIDDYAMSACAEACYTILHDLGVDGKHICIIGRGHAAKGLAAALLADNAAVTVCHSKVERERLNAITMCADVIVNASPVWTFFCPENAVVLDVGGVAGVVASVTAGEIGALTTAVLAHRASHYGG